MAWPSSSSSNFPAISLHSPGQYLESKPLKVRNIDRACDACRKRKTKCDGPRMTDHVCSNCIQSGRNCTYVEASKPRGPPKAYVTGLEDRLEAMEALFKRVLPDTDFSEELGPPIIRGSWQTESTSSPTSMNSPHQLLPIPSIENISPVRVPLRDKGRRLISSPKSRCSTHLIFDTSPTEKLAKTQNAPGWIALSDSASDSSSEADTDTEEYIEEFDGSSYRLTLRDTEEPTSQSQARFQGTSSPLKLVHAMRKLKQLHVLDPSTPQITERKSPSPPQLNPLRRQAFWKTPTWELEWEGINDNSAKLLEQIMTEFPPDDLANALIEIYFSDIHTLFPLLHRPTFSRQWESRLYRENLWFACLCSQVFAVASRISDDPRVLPKSVPKKESGELDWTKAGWDYFNIGLRVHRLRRSLLFPCTLFEVQTFSLMAMFLRGTDSHPTAWVFVSVGIRKAQDAGAHRKATYSIEPTLSEELWKRSFWTLVAFDRVSSACLGRPCGVGEEDFDLDLPLEVDDEYWETDGSNHVRCQPSDVPSSVTAFNLWIKLTQVIAFALRTIYAIPASKSALGRVPLSTNDAIAQMNQSLAQWADSVPQHLRWSPQLTHPVFAKQAANLYTTYHLTHMLIYRPFIPSPVSTSSPVNPLAKPTPFPFPALSLCTNAARCCARIVEHQLCSYMVDVLNMIQVSHISAAILLVSIWSAKAKLQRGEGEEKDVYNSIESSMVDITMFMRLLEWASLRYEIAIPLLKQLQDSLPVADRRSDQASKVGASSGSLPNCRHSGTFDTEVTGCQTDWSPSRQSGQEYDYKISTSRQCEEKEDFKGFRSAAGYDIGVALPHSPQTRLEYPDDDPSPAWEANCEDHLAADKFVDHSTTIYTPSQSWNEESSRPFTISNQYTPSQGFGINNEYALSSQRTTLQLREVSHRRYDEAPRQPQIQRVPQYNPYPHSLNHQEPHQTYRTTAQ